MRRRGSITQRSPGSWSIWIDSGRDAEGKRSRKMITFRSTKVAAERELTRLLRELDTGAFVDPSKLTVGEYLEKWLAQVKPGVGGKTWERYGEIVRLHLIPALGRIPLPKLTPTHIQDAHARALESGRKDGKGGLSAQTVLHHHRALKEALGNAVRLQLLARNPAEAVDPPRPRREEMQALDGAAAARLLAAVRDTSMNVPVVLALATGMRRGEILGLKWEDVDLDRGTLTVNRSLETTRGTLTFKGPKTQKGRRRITLPPFAVQALIVHRARQAEVRLLLGPAYVDQGLVLAGAEGGPMHPDSLTTGFRRLAKKAGVAGLRFHDLRHSHASQLLEQGIPLKVVSERLRHASVAITGDTYAHILPGMQEEAARRIEATLGGG